MQDLDRQLKLAGSSIMIIVKLEDYRATPRTDEKFYVADSEGTGERPRLLAG